MKILIDTHVLLWWLMNDTTLGADAKLLIASPQNTIFVSAISAWEIVIKKALGKLQAPDDLDKAIAMSHFHSLSVTTQHAMGITSLPPHHQDPFDRMLISQSKIEGCTLMTRDGRMGQYDIPIIWA